MTILGIDLGTTNSLCCVYINNECTLIPNIHGEYMTPSAIAINAANEVIVGKSALEYFAIDKHDCVKSFKRYMGSNKAFQLGKAQYRAEELSAIIVKNLKADAEQFLGHKVTKAIISVPAYFNNKQRKATKVAAELAGLNVIRLINEPTAAALSYGIASKENNTKYLVFDLGGGTFDVTVMELFEGILEVRSSAGDNFLGGDDFTQSIIQHFCKQHKLQYETLPKKLQNKLWNLAETCKISITQVNKEFALSIQHEDKDYAYTYDANNLEQIWSSLIQRLIQPLTRALNDSRVLPHELEAVVLVGGAAKMPVISKTCAKMFKKLPFTYHNPQHVVAIGAATLAGMLDNNNSISEMILTDVCPYTMGISCINEISGRAILEYSPIIERNSILPTSKSRMYFVGAMQPKVTIDIFQGESHNLDNNIQIGQFSYELKTPREELTPVEIRFTYDTNGILEVEIQDKTNSDKKIVLIKESCGAMTEKEMLTAMAKLGSIKIHPRDQDENLAIIAKAERMFEETLGDIRARIGYEIVNFKAVLESQDNTAISECRQELREFLNSLEVIYE